MPEDTEMIENAELEVPVETPEEEEIAAVTLGEVVEPKEGEEVPEASNGHKSLPGHLRGLLKDAKKELSEERKKRLELEAKLSGPQVQDILPPKPKFEDSYDSDKFATDLIAWEKRRESLEAEQNKKNEQQKAIETDYQSRLARYDETKALLPFDDFDVAESTVMNALDDTQRALIIKCARQPDVLVYGLGNSPEKLKALAQFKDPADFISNLAWLEARELKVEKRTATKTEPERTVKGTAPLVAQTVDKKMEMLEAEADRTGNRDKVIAYRRELKQRQQAALSR